MTETVGELLAAAETAFAEAELASPSHEAEYMLGASLKCSPAMLVIRREESVPDAVASEIRAQINRRLTREPADYVIGWKEFLGRHFRVDTRVLIPRPETEQLLTLAVAHARAVKGRSARVLELGTGSGIIAVSVSLECKTADVTAVDLSAGALTVARENAEALGAESVRFLQADLFGGLGPDQQGYFDIIVSNPPYVPTGVLPSLDPEVAFEPRLALDGGSDGLSVIHRLVSGAPSFLVAGGRLMLEIGYDQGERVRQILSDSGFREVQVLKDLEGHNRIVTGVSIGPV